MTKANAMMGQVTYTPRLLSSASRGNLEKARKKPGTHQIAQHLSGTYVIPKPINEMHRGLFFAPHGGEARGECTLWEVKQEIDPVRLSLSTYTPLSKHTPTYISK